MFHLQAGIHLDEAELPVLVQELQRAGVAVTQLRQCGGGDRTDVVTLLCRQRGGSRFFQQLLVTALQGAVTFAEMHHVAVRVGHDLQFDMAWLVEVFFQIHLIIAKGGAGFGAGDAPRFLQVGFGGGDLHATPAAASGSLDQHGIADSCRHFTRLLKVFQRTIRSGDQRHAQRHHGGLGGDLVAHHADMFRRRPDEGDAVGFHRFREIGIFRQEAIARMDGVRPGNGGRREDGRDIEVRVAAGRRADTYGFIRQADIHGIGVSRGMHGNRPDTQFATGPQDAQGDLATIGNEDLGKHYSMMTSASPNSTGSPDCTRILLRVPARGALIWLKVFIASISSSVCPALTCWPSVTNGGEDGSGAR